MAGNYPLPHWIPGPQDVAGQFMSGLHAGTQIQQQQAQLAQEANLQQMQMMLRQQESERQNTLEQQRMAQQQAYQQAEIGLRKQELQEAQQLNQIKIQDAARTFSAQQQFRDWVAAHPEEDPSSAYFKFFAGTTGMGTEAGSIARTMFQSRQGAIPPKLVTERDPSTGRDVSSWQWRNPSSGAWEVRQVSGRNTGSEAMVRMKIHELERRRDAMQKLVDASSLAFEGKSESDFKDIGLTRFKEWQKQNEAIKDLDKTINEMYETGEMPTSVSTGTGAAVGGGGYRVLSIDGVPVDAMSQSQVPPTAFRKPMEFSDPTGAPAAPMFPTPPGFGAGLTRPLMPPWLTNANQLP